MQKMQKQRNQSQLSKPRKGSWYINYTKSMYSAFKYDTEQFLEKFEEKKSLNYADFATIWQSMNFTLVYADQSYVKTLFLLCETCFLILKKYIMFQSSQYLKIGAFYLLYGLYYKQPIQNLIQIRLTLEEYREIKSLMEEMERKGQYDALYIFAKMKSDDAFLFVANEKPMGIMARPSSAHKYMDDTFSQRRHLESAIFKFENIFKDETVMALEKACKEYDAKFKLFAERKTSFLPLKSTLRNNLEEAYRQVYVQHSISEQTDEPEAMVENTRRSVKKKAMDNTNAQYRGSRKVITALDLDEDSEPD